MKKPVRRIGLAAIVVAACAQVSAPPGGPLDVEPPLLLATTPDSGRVRAEVDEVEFRFDEVISETPTGGSLRQLILVSPSAGDPDVRWRRSRITVRQRGGWRDSTTYVVTLLPGVADLSGNVRDEPTVLVFSTGSVIPNTRITGVVFDWTRDAVAPRALIQASPAADTGLVFTAEADSAGRFVLPFLVPGTYIVRGLLDANRNRAVDRGEPWDTVRVELRDSARHEFYAFAHDSIAPRAQVTLADSLTLRIALDRPLSPAAAALLPGIVEVLRPDSTAVPLASVRRWSVVAAETEARERARRDSIANADTSLGARQVRERRFRDSVNRAVEIADSIARDTVRRVPLPRPTRPPLISEIGVVFPTPVEPGITYRVRLRLTGMLGNERVQTATFSRPRPRPDSTSGRGVPPPAGSTLPPRLFRE